MNTRRSKFVVGILILAAAVLENVAQNLREG